jgi:hypothetical protein
LNYYFNNFNNSTNFINKYYSPNYDIENSNNNLSPLNILSPLTNSSPKTFNDIKQDVILTIQIPVYDESFDTVIYKTLNNLIAVCKNFNNKFDRQINILICEDGLQAIQNNKEINDRINYYNQHNEIFYIARKKK